MLGMESIRRDRVVALLHTLLPPSTAGEETWQRQKNKDVVHPPLLINIAISCLYLSEKCFRNELLPVVHRNRLDLIVWV